MSDLKQNWLSFHKVRTHCSAPHCHCGAGLGAPQKKYQLTPNLHLNSFMDFEAKRVTAVD